MEGTTYQAFAIKLGLTCSAASAAEAATYPIDAIKTRLQLQRQAADKAAAPMPRGALATALHVLRTEGAAGLYAGVSPAVVRHWFYSGTRITVYEQLRAAWTQSLEQPQQRQHQHQHQHQHGQQQQREQLQREQLQREQRRQQQQQQPEAQQQQHEPQQHGLGKQQTGLAAKLAMGATAGALGQLVAVPADLVKVRMLTDSRAVAAGERPSRRYSSMRHALSDVAAREGVRGLWRGTAPAVQRAALVNLGELATYDSAKQAVLASGWFGDGLLAHTAASACSGLVATVSSTPADVLKTRLMSQDAAAPQYRGMADCLVQTVRADGIGALYRGFLPTWLRLGPWQMVFWVSYEQLRAAAGMHSF